MTTFNSPTHSATKKDSSSMRISARTPSQSYNPPMPKLTASGRPRKIGVPKFLRFLYQILSAEDSKTITWANDGTSFQILDMNAMSTVILPKYFRHSKYASFQRQLNYFGFRKWTKTQTEICTFSHPHFVKDKPEDLKLIRRKNHPENPGSRKRMMMDNVSSKQRVGMDDIASSSSRSLNGSFEAVDPTSKRKKFSDFGISMGINFLDESSSTDSQKSIIPRSLNVSPRKDHHNQVRVQGNFFNSTTIPDAYFVKKENTSSLDSSVYISMPPMANSMQSTCYGHVLAASAHVINDHLADVDHTWMDSLFTMGAPASSQYSHPTKSEFGASKIGAQECSVEDDLFSFLQFDLPKLETTADMTV